MWSLIVNICLFSMYASFILAMTDVDEEDGVLVLNDENFDKVVEESEILLVEFYAPWCGHCKKLAPEYARAAQTLRAEGSPARLAKVDSMRHKRLAERLGVRGYPELRLWVAGRELSYTGERAAAPIAAWVRRHASRPLTVLNTTDEAAAFVDGRELAVVGFFRNRAEPAAQTFRAWAAEEEEMPLAVASAQAVLDKYGVQDGTVVMFKKYDERRHELRAPLEVSELKEWAAPLAAPLLLEFGADNADTVFGATAAKKAVLLFLRPDEPEFQRQTEAARLVAREHRGKVLFCWVDVNNDGFRRVFDFFGVRPEHAPAMRIVRSSDMAKFRPMEDGFSADSLRAFVASFLAGELKPYLLSEDLPEDWDARPVKVLVGTNFDEMVFDTSKDVLVDFYAPWCGHCRKLEPALEQLGEKYKDSKTVVIAKIDATLNELKKVRPRSFPTIKMWKKKTNEVVEYNGERTANGMAKFIETGGEYGRAPPDEDYEDYDEDDELQDYEDDVDHPEYYDSGYGGHDEL